MTSMPDRAFRSARSPASNEPAGRVRLAVFGNEGSFTEEAGRAYARREGLDCEVGYHVDPGELMRAVDDGRFDLGILPVMNSGGGLVRASFEALGRHSFNPVGQISVPIRHFLLVRNGTSASDITEVVSHHQALLQCEHYIAKHFAGVSLRPYNDTASAAHDLSRGEFPTTTAVLASRRAAERFDLVILAEDVQDAADNQTTFVVFERGQRP